MNDPEVDDVVPYWYGKRYILCRVRTTGVYGIWDAKHLDRAPSTTYADWNAAWASYLAVEKAPQEVIVRCPTCRSRWVNRLTDVDRLGEAMTWGVAAGGRIAKTFACTRCGYTW